MFSKDHGHKLPHPRRRHGRLAFSYRSSRLCLSGGWRLAVAAVAAVVAVLALLTPEAAVAGAAPGPGKRVNVLFVASQDKDLPAQISIEDGLDSVLAHRTGGHNVYFEYLSGARLPAADVEGGLIDYWRRKYASVTFDVVVAGGWQAAWLVARNQDAFGKARRIYLEISTTDRDRLSVADSGAEIILALSDYEKSLKEALEVSRANRIYVVGETAGISGKIRAESFRKAAQTLPANITVEYILDMPMDRLLDLVPRLPRGSMIYYLLIFGDAEGGRIRPFDAAALLAERASAPMFSQWESLIGSGIVGGYVLSGVQVGKELGSVILGGSQVPGNSFAHVYDWRQMERWRLLASALPPGSLIRFREPGVFDQYRWHILAIGAVIVAMAGLLIFLFRVIWERDAVLRMLSQDRALLAERVAERTAALTRESEQRLAAMQAAETANRTKSAFLAMMSHEIRTPMTGVLGMVDFLSQTPLNPQQKLYIDTMRSAAKALLSILNDILDYSKIEASHLKLDSIPCDVVALAADSVCLFTHKAEENGCSLSLDVGGRDSLVVRGDPTRIRQVLGNLISNAVKFTLDGRISVRVGARDRGDRVGLWFEVEDTGIGLSEDDLGRLFQPFSQVGVGTVRKYGGTGLGLAISKQLVELMGGEISVRSQLGRGSVFRFTCLVERARPEDIAPAAPSAVTRGALSILMAEDNPISAMVVKAGLEARGHQVTVVGDGAQACEKAAGTSFDLILMDMHMPVMDGMEAIRRIRAQPKPLSDVPIVALTADIQAGEDPTGESAGLLATLTKPVEWGAVEALLAQIRVRTP